MAEQPLFLSSTGSGQHSLELWYSRSRTRWTLFPFLRLLNLYNGRGRVQELPRSPVLSSRAAFSFDAVIIEFIDMSCTNTSARITATPEI